MSALQSQLSNLPPTVLLVGLVVLVATGLAATEIVAEDQQRVVTVFGRYWRRLGPGVHLVPPFVATTHPVDLRSSDVTVRVEAPTADGAAVSATVTVRVAVEDPKAVFQADWDAETATSEAATGATRRALGAFDAGALTEERGRLAELVADGVREPLAEHGLRVEGVEVDALYAADQ